jgi:hypothetical protein
MDLYQFSLQRQASTARIAGLGGAFGALGADAGGVGVNPAGLGTFRKTTIQLSPAMYNQQSTGTYLGNLAEDGRSRVTFNNVGFVFAKQPTSKGTKWKQVNYGFTMNRYHNFLSEQRYNAVNPNSSMLDYFLEEANTGSTYFPEDYPFTSAMAYDVGLIYPSIPGNNSTDFFSLVPTGGVRQSEQIRSTGSTTDYSFSVGGNYDNKLYVGGGIGLMSSSFSTTETYREEDFMDSIFDFKDFTISRRLAADMDGFVFRLGTIFQPIQWFRLGISYESPVRYTVAEDYRTSLEANFDSVPTYAFVESPLFEPFIYRYRSPGRTTFSAAVLFGGKGLLSFDYDYVPNDQLRAIASNNETALWAVGVNQSVANLFRGSNNFRAGGEFVLGPLALRAGYAYWGSPYRAGVNTSGGDWVQHDISLGAGARFDQFMLDLSVTRAAWDTYRAPYVVAGMPENGVLFNNVRWRVMATVGFRLD